MNYYYEPVTSKLHSHCLTGVELIHLFPMQFPNIPRKSPSPNVAENLLEGVGAIEVNTWPFQQWKGKGLTEYPTT
jgi:hypothetical protein